MMECDNSEQICDINMVPAEILFIMFRFLGPRDMTRCRQVCIRWRDIIDAIQNDDNLWMRLCQEDYKAGWKEMWKSPNITTWFEMYRSLSVWPSLLNAHPSVKILCYGERIQEEIQSIAIQEKGVVMVHKQEGVSFYDISRLQLAERKGFIGHFDTFVELEDIVIMLGLTAQLHVIRKVNPNWNSDLNINTDPVDVRWFNDVKYFLVGDRTLFYYTYTNRLFAVDMENNFFCPAQLPDHSVNRILLPDEFECNPPMCAWGYKDRCLYILTMTGNMYMYVNGLVYLKFNLDTVDNWMDCLYQHSMLENLDWEQYYTLLADLKHQYDPGLLQCISIMRFHRGDMVFVGTQCTISLKIYYKPFINGELDLTKFCPLREYDLAIGICTRTLCATSASYKAVNGIEVVEIKGGHKVLVALQKKVVVFTYRHGVEQSSEEIEVDKNMERRGLSYSDFVLNMFQ